MPRYGTGSRSILYELCLFLLASSLIRRKRLLTTVLSVFGTVVSPIKNDRNFWSLLSYGLGRVEPRVGGQKCTLDARSSRTYCHREVILNNIGLLRMPQCLNICLTFRLRSIGMTGILSFLVTIKKLTIHSRQPIHCGIYWLHGWRRDNRQSTAEARADREQPDRESMSTCLHRRECNQLWRVQQ